MLFVVLTNLTIRSVGHIWVLHYLEAGSEISGQLTMLSDGEREREKEDNN